MIRNKLWAFRWLALGSVISLVIVILMISSGRKNIEQLVITQQTGHIVQPIQEHLTKQSNVTSEQLSQLESAYHISLICFTKPPEQAIVASYHSSDLPSSVIDTVTSQVLAGETFPSVISIDNWHVHLLKVPNMAQDIVALFIKDTMVNERLYRQTQSIIVGSLALIGIWWLLFYRAYLLPLKRTNEIIQQLAQDNHQIQFPLLQQGIAKEMTQSLQLLNHKIKTQQQILSTTEYQHSVLINHLVLGIVVIDATDKIILTNPAANAMLDLEEKQWGMRYTSVIKSYPIVEMIERVRQQRTTIREEVELWVPQTQIVDVNIVPFSQNQRSEEILILLYDLTAIRKLEDVRSEFVANASHELRTPVTAIKGFAETLQNGALNNPAIAQKFVDIIAVESQRLVHIIEDILALSKIEKHQLSFNIRRFDIIFKLRAMSHLFAERIAQKKMTLQLPMNSCIMIETDEQRLENIMTNLIDNAINYSEPNKTITVRVEESAQFVRISVTDQGYGIPKEEQERIFERFYRVDKARSRQTGGTGLGLSIVRHLVKTMNGTIELTSKVGEGSTFTIRLPKKWC